MAIQNTGFKLPLAVIANASGVAGWVNPNNILFADDQFATSSGPAQIMLVGSFNLNIPQGSTLLNFTIRVKGYRGSNNTILQIYAVDDTSGVELAYPYTPPFQGFDGTNTAWTLNSTLFATTWTVDQANNIKLKLIADGELHLDDIEISASYEDNVPPTPPSPSPSGETVCSEFVQAQPFTLARSASASDLALFLTSFNYPSPIAGAGAPILIGDFYDDALIVVDQGKPNEENFRITNVEHDYQGTGFVKLTIAAITDRGLMFKYPYTHNINQCYFHGGNAQVVISNSAPFYDRFLKKCQIGALVSAPIQVLKEDVVVADPTTKFNFHGSVTVLQDGVDPEEVDIYITNGGGTTPAQIVPGSVVTATSGGVRTGSANFNVTVSGLNRLVPVQVATEQTRTILSVTVGGVAAVQSVSSTEVPFNLRSEIWTCPNAPLGVQPVIVTFSSAAFWSAGAFCVVGADTTAPIGATQTATGISTNPTLVLNTTVDNSIVIDALATAVTPIAYTVGAGQGLNWSESANANIRNGASSVESAGLQPDAVTMDYTMTQNTHWAYCAVEIKGITSSAGSQAGIQFQDENGANLGSAGTVDEFQISGPSVTASRVGNKVTYAISASGGGGGVSTFIDQTPDNGTYGLLSGAVDGVNTTFTVSNGSYTSGTLLVQQNGLTLLQGASDDWVETTPGSGTFDFNTAPSIGDIITVEYQTSSGSAPQTGIQFEDEGVNLGSAGTVDELDFVGSGVTASRTGNKVTVNVPGGGGGGSSIVLTAGETINGATDPVPVFVGTNLDVQALGTIFTDDNWSDNGYDNYQPAVNTSGSPYTWNQNTKYAYKLTAGRVYDVFNFRDIRRQGVNNNDANFTINFYNAGVAEPTGAPIATQSVNFVFPGSGTGSYDLYIELGGEVDCTPVLGGGNNYWVELEIGTIIPGDSSDIETFSRHVAGGGNFLVWNGSAWVAGNVPAVQVIGIPNGDLVYRTYGSGGYVDIEPLSGIDYDISRGHFLGWVNQDVVKGDPVTVITDGLVTFTTPITASIESNYVIPASPSSIGGYESLQQDGAIPDTTTPTIGLMLTTTKIKINRNTIKTDQTFYQ